MQHAYPAKRALVSSVTDGEFSPATPQTPLQQSPLTLERGSFLSLSLFNLFVWNKISYSLD